MKTDTWSTFDGVETKLQQEMPLSIEAMIDVNASTQTDDESAHHLPVGI